MSERPIIELEFREPARKADFRRIYSGRGFVVEHSSLSLPAEYEFSWNGETNYIAIHDLILERGEVFVDGMDPVRARDLRNKLTYVPAGQSLTGWAAPADRKNGFTIVNFNAGLISDELEISFRENHQTPHFYFEDEALAMTMRKIELELASGGAGIYIESLSLVAAIEMSRMKNEQINRLLFRKGGLNRTQMNLLVDYIDANLEKDVTLDTLAGLVRLSRFHFSRSFKVAFGVSPVRYITGRRLAKAKTLLAGPRVGLTEVASAVGFGSVQQFIKVFREEMEVTPGEYRRNL